ncbi:MAG: carbon storage regulator CsrA [Syntrophomonadaceae bacterium]|jgi:carbon storage regulator
MLVLSRHRGESIIIGDSIEISVVDIQGEIVKIGIKAPRSVSVHRQEIYDQIQKANREAAQNLPTIEELKQLKEIDRYGM